MRGQKVIWTVGLWLVLASGAVAQTQTTLVDCLAQAGRDVGEFESCKARFITPCRQADAPGLCLAPIAQSLQAAVADRIADFEPSKPGDLGAETPDKSGYRQRVARAAFRRAVGIGAAECNFQADILPPDDPDAAGFRSICQTTALAYAYWSVIVRHRYSFPQIQTVLP